MSPKLNPKFIKLIIEKVEKIDFLAVLSICPFVCKVLKYKAFSKTGKAYSNDLIVLVEKDLVAIWIRKVLYFKASNETLEAYYIIKIAGVACFVLSFVCQWIDYVNCSILEQFLNFSNLPFHYNIRRGCLFNNPFRYSDWLVVIDLVGILVRKILTIKNLSETLELKRVWLGPYQQTMSTRSGKMPINSGHVYLFRKTSTFLGKNQLNVSTAGRKRH